MFRHCPRHCHSFVSGYDLLQLHLPGSCLQKCGLSWNVHTISRLLREVPTLTVCDTLSAGYKHLSRDLQNTVFVSIRLTL
jgi:hypothetical protein